MSTSISSIAASSSNNKGGLTTIDAAGSTQLANVTKRLQKELMDLMMSPSAGISAFPSDDSDLTKWAGSIEGPDVSPPLSPQPSREFRVSSVYLFIAMPS
jgi:hypothetical protein